MVLAIIQARTGSTRLPGKVLKLLVGKPMLVQELERVAAAKSLDRIVVATTDKQEDDAVAALAEQAGVSCFRGSEQDVLDRFYHAALAEGAKQGDVIVRITGDCPLQDPAVIDEVVDHLLACGADYTSTPANYPEGLDTEAFTFTALEAAANEAHLPSEREHVTPFIKNHSDRFVCDVWEQGTADHRTMHWSVDTEADFRFVEELYTALYAGHTIFSKDEVLSYLEAHPELLEINRGGTGFEGLEKSLQEDADYLKNGS